MFFYFSPFSSVKWKSSEVNCLANWVKRDVWGWISVSQIVKPGTQQNRQTRLPSDSPCKLHSNNLSQTHYSNSNWSILAQMWNQLTALMNRKKHSIKEKKRKIITFTGRTAAHNCHGGGEGRKDRTGRRGGEKNRCAYLKRLLM